jgi:hypothetical protein
MIAFREVPAVMKLWRCFRSSCQSQHSGLSLGGGGVLVSISHWALFVINLYLLYATVRLLMWTVMGNSGEEE